MICERCGTAYSRDADPYGTGDYWYVLYEPNCTCEETQESDEAEEKSKMYSTMLRNAILAAHFDFMNQDK